MNKKLIFIIYLLIIVVSTYSQNGTQRDPQAQMLEDFSAKMKKPSDDIVYGSKSFNWEKSDAENANNLHSEHISEETGIGLIVFVVIILVVFIVIKYSEQNNYENESETPKTQSKPDIPINDNTRNNPYQNFYENNSAIKNSIEIAENKTLKEVVDDFLKSLNQK